MKSRGDTHEALPAPGALVNAKVMLTGSVPKRVAASMPPVTKRSSLSSNPTATMPDTRLASGEAEGGAEGVLSGTRAVSSVTEWLAAPAWGKTTTAEPLTSTSWIGA